MLRKNLLCLSPHQVAAVSPRLNVGMLPARFRTKNTVVGHEGVFPSRVSSTAHLPSSQTPAGRPDTAPHIARGLPSWNAACSEAPALRALAARLRRGHLVSLRQPHAFALGAFPEAAGRNQAWAASLGGADRRGSLTSAQRSFRAAEVAGRFDLGLCAVLGRAVGAGSGRSL